MIIGIKDLYFVTNCTTHNDKFDYKYSNEEFLKIVVEQLNLLQNGIGLGLGNINWLTEESIVE